ncbi:MAG: hypothetical protein ACR2GE_06100 [Pseudonocardia sp.]
MRAVALVGEDPSFLRTERDGAGWRTAGLGAAYPDCTPPRRWGELGRCWDGIEHAVVDATGQY